MPEHTYWSMTAPGFTLTAQAKTNTPRCDVRLQALLPEGFALLSGYAPYDSGAGAGVRVAVIDSGVGPHDQLQVSGGACLVAGEDRKDYADNGIGHGTHVAGIIAARLNEGVYGLAPACELRSYRVCPRAGRLDRCLASDLAAALEQAVADGCDLVNMSLGSLTAMPEMQHMLEAARNAGVVVFAATGNDGKEMLRYPARYGIAWAVTALGRDGSFPANSLEVDEEGPVRREDEFVANFSNYGRGTDFIGPGLAVVSTYPANRYAVMSGTSMATPFTTGMAARLLSVHEAVRKMPRDALRHDAIVRLLTDSTRTPGWPDIYGAFGVVR